LDQLDSFNHWWLAQIFAGAIGKPLPIADLDMQVQFQPGARGHETVFKALLSLMARYGGIGAKTQYGFGQFDWAEKSSATEALEAIRDQLGSRPQRSSSQPSDCYTLRDFWHLKCLVPETDPLIQRFRGATLIGDQGTFTRLRDRYLPVSFDIRYKLPRSDDGLRQSYRISHGKMATRDVFGTLKGTKRGSRVFVSHLYKEASTEENYRLNIWGFTETGIGREMQQQVKKVFASARTTMTTGPQLLRQEGASK